MLQCFRKQHSHGGPAMARHLTLAERQVLQELLQRIGSRTEVARLMNRHPSTIYRELSRNSSARGYRAKHAQRVASDRRRGSRRPCKLADLDVRQYVAERLQCAWSPDQIAGRV